MKARLGNLLFSCAGKQSKQNGLSSSSEKNESCTHNIETHTSMSNDIQKSGNHSNTNNMNDTTNHSNTPNNSPLQQKNNSPKDENMEPAHDNYHNESSSFQSRDQFEQFKFGDSTHLSCASSYHVRPSSLDRNTPELTSNALRKLRGQSEPHAMTPHAHSSKTNPSHQFRSPFSSSQPDPSHLDIRKCSTVTSSSQLSCHQPDLERMNILRRESQRRAHREKMEQSLHNKEKQRSLQKKEKRERIRDSLKQRRLALTRKRREKRSLESKWNQELAQEQEESRQEYRGASSPDNEEERLMALKEYEILDTPVDSNFDRLTTMATELFNVPICLISLLDDYRQWFLSVQGIPPRYTCRNVAFCAYAIHRSDVMVIPETFEDSRFKNNPLVTGDPHIRFYAGAPLETPCGFRLGTFCVIDQKPRHDFDEKKCELLKDLSRVVVRELELYKSGLLHRRNGRIQEAITQFSQNALQLRYIQETLDLATTTLAECFEVDLAFMATFETLSNRNESNYCKLNVKSLFCIKNEDDQEETISREFVAQEFRSIGKQMFQHYNQPHCSVLPIQAVSQQKDALELPDIVNELCDIQCGWLITLFNNGKPYGVLGAFMHEKQDIEAQLPVLRSFGNSISASIERTLWENELASEQERADSLLLNVLPKPISTRLKANEAPIADGYTMATVCFADIVGFTAISEQVDPKDLVSLLNVIFSRFDKLAKDKYGLEKVKTIGDCYMVAGGLLTHEDDHPQVIVDLALDMLRSIRQLNREYNTHLDMRVGINTGPVVAGVIGTHKFLYDLWGDAVNVASRMESSGVPGKIQITQATLGVLPPNIYYVEDRGMIEIKGKGPMEAFLITLPEDGLTSNLIEPEEEEEKQEKQQEEEMFDHRSSLSENNSIDNFPPIQVNDK